jgi:inosine/xanthosine triphosphatase
MKNEKRKGKTTRVSIASKNPTKVRAVEKVLKLFFRRPIGVPKKAKSGIREQPRTLAEIVRGAKNRVKNAWEKGVDFAVGLESGWMKIPGQKGTFDVAVCVVFDGKTFNVGLSPAFEVPPRIVHHVQKNQGHMSGAFEAVFPESGKNLGEKNGAIGFLTRQKYVRQNLNEHAFIMALVPFLNKDQYA